MMTRPASSRLGAIPPTTTTNSSSSSSSQQPLLARSSAYTSTPNSALALAASQSSSNRSVRWGDTTPQAPSTPGPFAASSTSNPALVAFGASSPATPQQQQHMVQHNCTLSTSLSTLQQRGVLSFGTPQPATPSAGQTASTASQQSPAPTSLTTATPSSSVTLSRRAKWNASALALLWLLPLVSSRPKEVYWDFLDVVYHAFGGSVDEKLDAVLGWISWATSIVLFFNLLEATILQRRIVSNLLPPAPASSQTLAQAQTQAAAQTSHQPLPSSSAQTLAEKQAQHQPLSSAAPTGAPAPAAPRTLATGLVHLTRGSPKTRPSSIGAASPLSGARIRSTSSYATPQRTATSQRTSTTPSTPTQDYSRFSPAFASASAGVGGGSTSPYSTSSPVGAMHSSPGSTHSPATAVRTSTTLGGSSSPLAAYRARNVGGVRTTRLGRHSAAAAAEEEEDVDGEGGAGMGDDSFEVERALRSLSQGLGGATATA